MLELGVYAVDDNENEIVFSMFTEPSGTPMASLFARCFDGTSAVGCGTYTVDTETDDEIGITWTVLTVSDVYSGEEVEIGIAETDDEQIFILIPDGTIFEGEYLTAEETIDYMAAAVNLIS